MTSFVRCDAVTVPERAKAIIDAFGPAAAYALTGGQCPEPATALVEAMCRHEHHAIRELCAWHTESALSTDLQHYCGECWDVDGHWCRLAARIIGKVGGRGIEVVLGYVSEEGVS